MIKKGIDAVSVLLLTHNQSIATDNWLAYLDAL